MKLFFDYIFNFIRTGRIHSTVDHMSDYTPIKNIILNSKLIQFRYNKRFDSYSFFLENKENSLVDVVLIFTFGKTTGNQIMITLNNTKIYFELSLTGVEKYIPLIHYQKEEKKKYTIFRASCRNTAKEQNFCVSLFRKKKTEPVKEIMTFEELFSFLEENKIQKGFKQRSMQKST